MPGDGDEEKYSTTECAVYYFKVPTELDYCNLADQLLNQNWEEGKGEVKVSFYGL